MKRECIPLVLTLSLLTLSLLTLSLLASSSLAAQTTTLTQETANNTSACSGVALPGPYCEGEFTGMSSSESGTFQPRPGNVSDVPLDRLLYPGNTTKMYIHLLPWFTRTDWDGTECHPSSTSFPILNDGSWADGACLEKHKYLRCRSHLDVGYASDDADTVDAQVSDMMRRGFDGIVIDWYGPPQTDIDVSVQDSTTLRVRDELDQRCAGQTTCPLHFTLMFDEGTFKFKQSPACVDAACILNKLKSDFTYADGSYFGSPSYLKEGGRPVVSFFIAESHFMNPCVDGAGFNRCNLNGCASSVSCWEQIWAGLKAHTQTLSYGDPLFVFHNGDSFSPHTAGGFCWPDASATDPGTAYLHSFYSLMGGHPGLSAWGGGWQGFDDSVAGWCSATGGPRRTAQRCGRTWLETIQAANDHYSSSSQLPYLQIATWNDYEEGTAIEPGIDNCWAISGSVSGTALSWSLSVPPGEDEPDAASWATEDTIDHYEIFDSVDGEHLTRVATRPRGTTAIDLGGLVGGGQRVLYVKAVGIPSVLNKISGPIDYTAPPAVVITSPPEVGEMRSPVRVTARENTSRSADSMQIYLDDKLAYTKYNVDAIDVNLSSPPGAHSIMIEVWYSDATFVQARRSFFVRSAPAVTLTAPAPGGQMRSPVRVLANENSPRRADSMQIYFDGALAYTKYNVDAIEVNLSGPPGPHSIVAKAWYRAGHSFSARSDFSISSAPAVTLTAPAPGGQMRSPVRVLAHENTARSADSMQIYLNGEAVYTQYNTDSLDKSLNLAPGSYVIEVKAWYSDGTNNPTSHTFTVR